MGGLCVMDPVDGRDVVEWRGELKIQFMYIL